MIVCVCRRVSHRDIEREVRDGCASFEELQDELGVATACGACAECAHGTFERACAEHHARGGARVIPVVFAGAAPVAAAA
jgi:bacterioferritin-associated ferredoxin